MPLWLDLFLLTTLATAFKVLPNLKNGLYHGSIDAHGTETTYRVHVDSDNNEVYEQIHPKPLSRVLKRLTRPLLPAGGSHANHTSSLAKRYYIKTNPSDDVNPAQFWGNLIDYTSDGGDAPYMLASLNSDITRDSLGDIYDSLWWRHNTRQELYPHAWMWGKLYCDCASAPLNRTDFAAAMEGLQTDIALPQNQRMLDHPSEYLVTPGMNSPALMGIGLQPGEHRYFVSGEALAFTCNARSPGFRPVLYVNVPMWRFVIAGLRYACGREVPGTYERDGVNTEATGVRRYTEDVGTQICRGTKVFADTVCIGAELYDHPENRFDIKFRNSPIDMVKQMSQMLGMSNGLFRGMSDSCWMWKQTRGMGKPGWNFDAECDPELAKKEGSFGYHPD